MNMKSEPTPKGLPPAVYETWSRRTLLEWLGKSVVLALGAELVTACSAAADGLYATASESVSEPVEASAQSGFPFAPSQAQGSVFSGWGERTVDSQDLKSILSGWSLRVDGLVTSPRSFSFVELLAFPRRDQVTDFHCVEGWSVYDVPWNGVHLADVFAAVEPTSSASFITLHCIGGTYLESLPLSEVLEPRTLLAYGIGGKTIPLRSGFPARLVIPRKLAYKNAKYVERIELTDRPVEGYWERYGYPYEADVPAARLRPQKY